MYSKNVTITPEMASEWLKKNVVNRGLRMTQVRIFADDMKRGQWDETQQSIGFNFKGELIDGQHRLHAIVMAGVSVKMQVSYDLPHFGYRELKVDKGIKRTFADSYKKPHKPAQIVVYLAKFALSSNVPEDYIANYYDLFGSYAELLMESCSTNTRIYSSAPMRAGAVLQLMENKLDEYVLNQYRALVLQDYGKMSKKIAALSKFCNLSGGPGRRFYPPEIFIRSYDAFDPKKANESRTVVGNMENRKELMKQKILEHVSKAQKKQSSRLNGHRRKKTKDMQ